MTFESQYTIGKPLGKGSYAEVFECTQKSDGKKWAVKVVDKTKIGAKDVSDVLHEVNIMKTLGEHKHLVHMKEFFDVPGKMLIVMDVVEGGPLFDRVIQLKHYSEDMASKLIRNFLLGLEHMHAKGIMHRDLKPENLLLKFKGVEEDALTNLSLADFGLSGVPPSIVCCGSPSYIAPEVINVGFFRKTTDPYTEKCDIWSVGVIAYILLSGKMPFHGKHHKETFTKICGGQWTFQGDVWGNVTDDARDFIKTLMTLDPAKRPSAVEALKHPWVVQTQPNTHLTESLDGLRELTIGQKARAAVAKLRMAKFFSGKSPLQGAVKNVPAFVTYLTPTMARTDKVLTSILVQSQSKNTVIHAVDLEAFLAAKDKPDWNCSQGCGCASASICRHIQYVYTWLFVGARESDIAPYCQDVMCLRTDAEADANDSPSDATAAENLRRIDHFLTVAQNYMMTIDRQPRDLFKSNFNFDLATSAGRAWSSVAGITTA